MDMPGRVEFIEANGLSFETAVAEGGERLALCLHGFPETSYSWRHQIAMLTAKGYTVWAPNLRGYGHSSRPRAQRDYEMPNLVADVAGLFDAATAQGLKPSLLMSHDWGGLIAWSFVLHKVRPVERFVAINIPHPERLMSGMWRNGQWRRSWYVLFFQIPWLPEAALRANNAEAVARAFRNTSAAPERFPEAVTDVYRANALIPGAARAMVNYYRANFAMVSASLRDYIFAPRTTDVPTLMLWGEEDVALGLHLTEGTQTLVPNLTLRTFPGVSHWSQQEAPEQLNPVLDAWLG